MITGLFMGGFQVSRVLKGNYYRAGRRVHMTIFPKNSETLAVIDTMLFVRAVASLPEEARFYAMAIRKCWKFVFSVHITDQYQEVINKYGHPGSVIQLELSKLQVMNKYRTS